MSDTGFGFETALAEMKRGAQVARLKWLNPPPGERRPKLRIALGSPGCIRTWYYEDYVTDVSIVDIHDILADDWVVVEPAATKGDE